MIRWLAAFLTVASLAAAEVHVDPDRSTIQDGWWRLEVRLGLTDITPYRVFTLDEPRRLVLDLEAADWSEISLDALLDEGRGTGLRLAALEDGWSRLVVDLAEPLAIAQAGMMASPEGADLTVMLEQVSAEEFASRAGSPPTALQDDPQAAAMATTGDSGFVVVIDPGHGGVDPGADQGGVLEADLMLQLGQEVTAALSGMPDVTVVTTRDDDSFVPLAQRISIARAAGADLLISLHADALEEDEAEGASVYTLAIGKEDAAARRMVERHGRADILRGVDLDGHSDQVAGVLMDLARQTTGPEGREFADLLVMQMRAAGVRLNSRPRREAQLAVLAAADFPSVLIEAGFLSNANDRARLLDPAKRALVVEAIVAAVRAWKEAP